MSKTVLPGKYYEVNEETGEHTEIEPQETALWVCRRLADFPGNLPEGVGKATCEMCSAPIGYAVEVKLQAIKVCFQCSGYAPVESN